MAESFLKTVFGARYTAKFFTYLLDAERSIFMYLLIPALWRCSEWKLAFFSLMQHLVLLSHPSTTQLETNLFQLEFVSFFTLGNFHLWFQDFWPFGAEWGPPIICGLWGNFQNLEKPYYGANNKKLGPLQQWASMDNILYSIICPTNHSIENIVHSWSMHNTGSSSQIWKSSEHFFKSCGRDEFTWPTPVHVMIALWFISICRRVVSMTPSMNLLALGGIVNMSHSRALFHCYAPLSHLQMEASSWGCCIFPDF